MSNISISHTAMSKEKNKHPFGGFFAAIGAFVGIGYAAQIDAGPLVALGGLIVGAWLGLIVEHVVFRLIVIGLFVLMIVARHAFFDAVFDEHALHFMPDIPTRNAAQIAHAMPPLNTSIWRDIGGVYVFSCKVRGKTCINDTKQYVS